MAQQRRQKKLSSTKQKLNDKKIIAFDIETYQGNEHILKTGFYDEASSNKVSSFADSYIESIMISKNHRDAFLVATNLSFDLFQSLDNKKLLGFITTNWRGSHLLSGKIRFEHGQPVKVLKSGSHGEMIIFADTMNYYQGSVEKMGELINIPKMKADVKEMIGRCPKNHDEWVIMCDYNLRDCEISAKFFRYLITGFEEYGATFKTTIASTAMSLFRNRYLGDDEYWVLDKETLKEILQSYYGGRCEIFSRGKLIGYFYHDLNSLYPSVMVEHDYPDPRVKRFSYTGEQCFIDDYEGFSRVSMTCPNMKYPVLPTKLKDGKVVFACGHIEGWYTHIEIRAALKRGYVMDRIFKTIYFPMTCRPFDEYVITLYDKRKKYKLDGNKIMGEITKLLMNSLYGKFGEKFDGIENVTHIETLDMDKIGEEFDIISQMGDYCRVMNYCEPAPHCIPAWASYVTAYARLKLLDYIEKYNPAYVDTDSCICKEMIEDSLELGLMKIEMFIDEGIFVKPKMYAIKSGDMEISKVKGLQKAITEMNIDGYDVNIATRPGKQMTYEDFKRFCKKPHVKYDKFIKFKESLRREIPVNKLIWAHKSFTMEDDKRRWDKPFNTDELQVSRPHFLSNPKPKPVKELKIHERP